MAETKIGVYTELPGGKPPVRVGTLWAVGDRARQGAKFEYDAAWLAHPQGYGLEPALQLARAAGLSVPPFRLETLVAGDRRRHVLVVKKFDRGPAGERIPYLSAMSLLDAEDGDRRSYLELAEAMQPSCVDYRRQLRELWRRMAFNHLVCNTDDHMRNHGFLRLRPGGWELSPLFDVNPTPPSAAPRDRATPLTPEGEAVNRETLLECCTSFHLRLSEAQDAWTHLQNAMAGWRAAASAFRIPKREHDRMADAFTTC